MVEKCNKNQQSDREEKQCKGGQNEYLQRVVREYFVGLSENLKREGHAVCLVYL